MRNMRLVQDICLLNGARGSDKLNAVAPMAWQQFKGCFQEFLVYHKSGCCPVQLENVTDRFFRGQTVGYLTIKVKSCQDFCSQGACSSAGKKSRNPEISFRIKHLELSLGMKKEFISSSAEAPNLLVVSWDYSCSSCRPSAMFKPGSRDGDKFLTISVLGLQFFRDPRGETR